MHSIQCIDEVLESERLVATNSEGLGSPDSILDLSSVDVPPGENKQFLGTDVVTGSDFADECLPNLNPGFYR
jgi:hypothetical protein